MLGPIHNKRKWELKAKTIRVKSENDQRTIKKNKKINQKQPCVAMVSKLSNEIASRRPVRTWNYVRGPFLVRCIAAVVLRHG